MADLERTNLLARLFTTEPTFLVLKFLYESFYPGWNINGGLGGMVGSVGDPELCLLFRRHVFGGSCKVEALKMWRESVDEIAAVFAIPWGTRS